LFLTYFSNYMRRLGYIMDAAYWVYIIHLPIVAFIPGLLSAFVIPVFIKFLITLLLTVVLCFLSYHFMVRSTFIGMFLNGKVHKRLSSKV
jgi:glucan biosynthesis protein C